MNQIKDHQLILRRFITCQKILIPDNTISSEIYLFTAIFASETDRLSPSKQHIYLVIHERTDAFRPHVGLKQSRLGFRKADSLQQSSYA